MIPRDTLEQRRRTGIRANRKLCGPSLAAAAILCPFLLSSCALRTRSALVYPPELPAEITLPHDAGRGGHLMVFVRLESGEELPFLLDTGAPGTVFDRSLEPRLGRPRGTMSVRLAGKATQRGGLYESPRIYLGDTPLVTGAHVATYDFKQHPMGILGMDCLKHYCIQLDFQAGKLRFLSSSNVPSAGLGQAFPLTFESNYPFINRPNLAGQNTRVLVDLGCNIDGLMDSGTNEFDGMCLTECSWANSNYTNLTVAAMREGNALGLTFLARHVVTFDFPGRMMYLKQTCVGPLAQNPSQPTTMSPRLSAFRFLQNLKDSRQLPGWLKEKAPIFFQQEIHKDPNAVSYVFWTDGDSDRYHYRATRASRDESWKLDRAWRTDRSNRVIEEYPTP